MEDIRVVLVEQQYGMVEGIEGITRLEVDGSWDRNKMVRAPSNTRLTGCTP